MNTLIVQADDAAISHGTTLGILEAIDHGPVRSLGVFTNCVDAGFAASALRDRSDIDVGLDLNFVTGRPLSDVDRIPSLVDDTGRFRSSTAIKASRTAVRIDGPFWEFDTEPFDEEHVRIEAEAQLRRFQQLFGRPPVYLHHHSLVTPVTDRALRDLAAQAGILAMDDLYRTGGIPLLPNDWYVTPFDIQTQADADAREAIGPLIDRIRESELSILITHPGYVDAEVLDASSYSVIRAKDLQLLLDPHLMQSLTAAGIRIASYRSAGLA